MSLRHLSFLLFCLLLAACDYAGNRQAERYIRIDGSSTVFPITEALTEQFYNQQKQYKVVVGVSGTGGGLRKLLRGEIDICNASRPMSEQERQQFESAGLSLLEIPVALDGIVIAVNKANHWADDIKVSELQQLWRTESQGKTMYWSDLRRGWPRLPVVLFGAGPSSGTYDFFTAVVNGKARSGRGDYAASENDHILVKGISGDKGALGYFGYTYFKENEGMLKALPVVNDLAQAQAVAIAPTAENIKLARYQPFTREQFLYVRRDALQRRSVASFLQFYVANIAQLSESLAFIPFPEGRYRAIAAEIEQARLQP